MLVLKKSVPGKQTKDKTGQPLTRLYPEWSRRRAILSCCSSNSGSCTREQKYSDIAAQRRTRPAGTLFGIEGGRNSRQSLGKLLCGERGNLIVREVQIPARKPESSAKRNVQTTQKTTRNLEQGGKDSRGLKKCFNQCVCGIGKQVCERLDLITL
jgi:hypothetical protein